MFNKIFKDIFDEVTQAKGNEFYFLEKESYDMLFSMEYDELRYTLFENGIIYIGLMIDNEFVINSKKIDTASKIVVLTQGS